MAETQEGAPEIPPRNPTQIVPTQFVRAPPTFKTGTDVNIYLKRFDSYAAAINCPEGEKANLLVSLLDDKTLLGIDLQQRPEEDPKDLETLKTKIRTAEGWTQNSEKWIGELRGRRRQRGESIWDFHLALHTLAKRAYPHDEIMRTGSLRETFIANLGHPQISARLREKQTFTMPELLDFAILLHNCSEANYKSQVNAAEWDTPTSQDKTVPDLTKTLQEMSITLKRLTDFQENSQRHQRELEKYAYQGSKQSGPTYSNQRQQWKRNYGNQANASNNGYNSYIRNKSSGKSQPKRPKNNWGQNSQSNNNRGNQQRQGGYNYGRQRNQTLNYRGPWKGPQ